jgi:hypothetical protein
VCDSSDHAYDNHPALMAFNNWLAEQPELATSGFVGGSNDHRAVSTTLWWSGPRTPIQERVLDEARSRGIQASIRVAKYSKEDLERAATLIFGASDALATVNFEIAVIGAFDAQHDGLRLEGFDPLNPEEPLSESARAAVRRVLQGIDVLEDLVDLPDILIEHGDKPVPL